jgi:LacI family transcriptional regulator
MGTETKRNRVTLKTVAERAGVSVATVSLILSGRDEWLRQFHPDTISKVQQCAKRLGYRANIFATGLPMKKSSFFSLVLEDMTGHDLGTWHHWAFEGSLLAGIVRAAVEKKLYPVVATAHHETDDTGIQQIGKIINGGVFGTIVRSPNPALEKYLKVHIKQGHPVVVIFPRRLQSWPGNALDVDNLEIGRTAGRILLARQRRNWVLVRYRTLEGAHHLRCDGFLEFARDAGVRVQVVQIGMNIDEFGARDQIEPELARVKPDGIFAVDSVASVGSAMGARGAGATLGEDVDLLGCDCSLFQSQNLPTITSIDVSWREVGVYAIHKLIELSNAGQSTFETVLLPPRVLSGGTCPVPPEIERPESTTTSSPPPEKEGQHCEE